MAHFIALEFYDFAPPECDVKHQLINLETVHRLGMPESDWEWPQWPEGGKWADIVIGGDPFYISAAERDRLLDFIKENAK